MQAQLTEIPLTNYAISLAGNRPTVTQNPPFLPQPVVVTISITYCAYPQQAELTW